MTAPLAERRRRFIEAYGEHRHAEGHGGLGVAELLSLPYLRRGPIATAWRVRARTYSLFVKTVVTPLERSAGRPLSILHAGAGNGWLSYRLTRHGHHATAIDLRAAGGDSLERGSAYARHLPSMFGRVATDFADLPFDTHRFDIVAFNASLHYAFDLSTVLAEARRVLRPGGLVAVLDSPFYRRLASGEAMVEEKLRTAVAQFGERHDALVNLPFIEFLTVDRLRDASQELGMTWRRHRVRYPWRYEMRPLIAALRGKREPSRFDLWVARRTSFDHE